MGKIFDGYVSPDYSWIAYGEEGGWFYTRSERPLAEEARVGTADKIYEYTLFAPDKLAIARMSTLNSSPEAIQNREECEKRYVELVDTMNLNTIVHRKR